MTSISITEGLYKGRKSITLESGGLKAVILPELGSKMASLVLKATGKELLYQGPKRIDEYKLPKYGDSYGDYDISGFDECFPSILESVYPLEPYKGEIIVDHGEVWCQKWDYSIRDNQLEMWVKGIRFPYRLSKRIWVSGDTVIKLEYKVENLSDEELAFLWCPHILLNCDENTRIVLPPKVDEIIQSMPEGSTRLGRHFLKYSYPACKDIKGEDYRLDRMYPLESKGQEKFYTSKEVKDGWCAIYNVITNEVFRLSFPPEIIPYIGVWASNGGFMDQHVIALEPANIPLDTLESAVKAGYPVKPVKPWGEVSWYLNMIVGKSKFLLI